MIQFDHLTHDFKNFKLELHNSKPRKHSAPLKKRKSVIINAVLCFGTYNVTNFRPTYV